MSVLCWGFVNDHNYPLNTKRYYGLLGIGINFSGIAAGQVAMFFSKHVYDPRLPFV